jgi:biopolymer transport protein ExbD
MAATSRGKAMREARRAAQFSKFRLISLNLVPLVDTFVSIVFFALTTQTLGAVAPMVRGVNLPETTLESPAIERLTLGVSREKVVLGQGERFTDVMSTQQAAAQRSSDPAQPLVIPNLYAALKQRADSIRAEDDVPANQSVETTLAVQAEKSMRYALLARVIQTARVAGFKNLTLQVLHVGDESGEPAPAPAT